MITVWKIVHRSGKRLWSAFAGGALSRIYMDADGTFPVVSEALAFNTAEHAETFLIGIEYNQDLEVWQAECAYVSPVSMVSALILPPFGCSNYDEVMGRHDAIMPAPFGTLLCQDLKLVKRMVPE